MGNVQTSSSPVGVCGVSFNGGCLLVGAHGRVCRYGVCILVFKGYHIIAMCFVLVGAHTRICPPCATDGSCAQHEPKHVNQNIHHASHQTDGPMRHTRFNAMAMVGEPHLHGDWLTRATSAPGLGSPSPTSAPRLGTPVPRLRRDLVGVPTTRSLSLVVSERETVKRPWYSGGRLVRRA